MRRKISSILVCLCLLFSFTGVFGAEKGDMETTADGDFQLIYYEEFSNYATGTPIGWTASPLAVSPYKMSDKQGRVAKFESTDALFDANMQMVFSPNLTGKVVLETKIYPTDVVSRRPLFTTKDSSNRENVLIAFNNNGYITAAPSDQKIMMYKPNKWYHVQTIMDYESKTYDLYIDGEKKLTSQPFANKELENLWLLRFGQWDRNHCSAYLDDIVVYKSNRVYTQYELNEKAKVYFTDVDNNFCQEAVTHFENMRLLNNTDDHKFRPDSVITNQEFVAMVGSIMRFPEKEYVNIFMDVKADDDYAAIVQSLSDAGIFNGYAGKFNATQKVTLKSATNTMCEIYKFSTHMLPGEPEKKFSNLQEKGQWIRNIYGQAEVLGLYKNVKGIKNPLQQKDAELTRGQVIVMMKNLVDTINK